MKNKSRVTVLLIRNSGESNVSFTVSTTGLKVLAVLFGLLVISVTAFILYYGRIAASMAFVQKTQNENMALKEKNKKMELLKHEIERIRAFEKKIRVLTMNYEGEKNDAARAAGERRAKQAESVYEKEIEAFVKNLKLQRNLHYIRLKDDLTKRRKILASTPNILPVDGWISRGFREISDKDFLSHKGIDIAAAHNSIIKAAGPGIVTFTGWKKDFGNFIEIDHGHGFVSHYGHCSKVIVKKGDLVERSQTIGFVGSTGRSSAPHLHFEVVKDGKNVDPLIYILK